MGQYFMAVNKTKHEYFTSYDLDRGAKFWEWLANNTPAAFAFLLRKSDEGGGGDIDWEGKEYVGRWAGDEIFLVGDYDSSRLYQQARESYKNISAGLVKEFNEFMHDDDLNLGHDDDMSA